MTRYAVLIGDAAPEKGMQKSLLEFKDFLTSEAGGFWREEEIMISGPLDWQLVQFLQTRLREYGFVLVYRCRFSRAVAGDSEGGTFNGVPDGADWSGKLRYVTEGGHGVFISDVCDEVVGLEELGYERLAERAEEAV